MRPAVHRLSRLLALIGLTAALAGCGAEPRIAPLLWRTGLWCGGAPADRAAARLNAVSLDGPAFDAFGRPERGWAIYAPLIQHEIATRCAPQSPGFAAALATWRVRHGLSPSGRGPSGQLDTAAFAAIKAQWQGRRPFVALRAAGICPAPPPPDALEAARPQETLGGKVVRLRPRALAAYRRMVAAARSETGILDDDPSAFALFSGFRDPAADAARCAAQNNCQGLVRAACSAHRTGLALDLDVGWAPGHMADDSADANRLYQTRGRPYRWLVRNAARFGFVNYLFEPWHWEWTGETP